MMPGPEWLDKPGQPEWDPFDYTKDFTWMGFDRGLDAIIKADPEPTLEERQERCEQMGLVFCTCKLDNGRVVVYNPTCPVHQHFCKL